MKTSITIVIIFLITSSLFAQAQVIRTSFEEMEHLVKTFETTKALNKAKEIQKLYKKEKNNKSSKEGKELFTLSLEARLVQIGILFTQGYDKVEDTLIVQAVYNLDTLNNTINDNKAIVPNYILKEANFWYAWYQILFNNYNEAFLAYDKAELIDTSFATVSMLRGDIFDAIGTDLDQIGDMQGAVENYELAILEYKKDLKKCTNDLDSNFVEFKLLSTNMNLLQTETLLSLYINDLNRVDSSYTYLKQELNKFKNIYTSEEFQVYIDLLGIRLEFIIANYYASSINQEKEYLNTTIKHQEAIQTLIQNFKNEHQEHYAYQINKYNVSTLVQLSRLQELNGIEYNENEHLTKAKSELEKYKKDGFYSYELQNYGIVLFNLGKCYLAYNKLDEALPYFQKALYAFTEEEYKETTDFTINPEIKDINNLMAAMVLSGKAETFEKKASEESDSNNLKIALQIINIAISQVDALNQTFFEEAYLNLENTLFYDKINANYVYFKGVEINLKLYEISKDTNYLNEAFNLLEKSKSVRLKTMAANVDAISDDRKSIIQDLKLRASNHKKLATNTNEFERNFEAYRTYKQAVKDSINTWQIKYTPPIELTIDTLQNEVGKETVLLEFKEGVEFIYLFRITNDTFNYYKFDKNEINYDEVLIQYKSSILNDTFLLFKQTASILYDFLLKEALSDEVAKNKKRLVIIPDRSLCYISFDALIKSNDNEHEFWSDLPYLIKDYAITYDYSAYNWKEMQTTHYQNEEVTLIEADINNNECPNLYLPSLQESINAEYYLIRDGNIFRNYLKNIEKNILFFNLHGKAKPSDILYSYLPLCCNPGDSLELWELYGTMNIHVNLVILNSCLSNIGQVSTGEGLISLTTGFRSAGCPSVVSTLWEVSANTSSTLLIDFTNKLEEFDKDIALQKVKVEMINNDGRFSSPYYWAGNILVGNRNKIND